MMRRECRTPQCRRTVTNFSELMQFMLMPADNLVGNVADMSQRVVATPTMSTENG